MRNGHSARARRLVALSAVALLSSTACNIRHELVLPETPGVIDPGAVDGPTGANGLRIGALGALKLQTGSGESLWQLGGLLADEWRSSSSNAATNDIDRRSTANDNASLTVAYSNIQQARGYFRDALDAMNADLPQRWTQIGELYFGLA